MQVQDKNEKFRIKNKYQFERYDVFSVDYENIRISKKKILAVGNLDSIHEVTLFNSIDGFKVRNSDLLILLDYYDNITSLTIEVEGNTITNDALSGIGSLKKLNELRMTFLLNTNITDSGYAFLSNLKELELFSVEQVNFGSEGMKGLSKLKKLKKIYISNSKILKNEDFKYLSNNKNLEIVNIRFCKNVNKDVINIVNNNSIKVVVGNN